MSIPEDMEKAMDAVYAGLPTLLPRTLNYASATLPNNYPYNGSPWLCFVIRCATNNELDFVKIALDAGADCNEPHVSNGCKMYPLHLAVKHGQPAIVRELLRRGADRFARTNAHQLPDDILNCIRPLELEETIVELEEALQTKPQLASRTQF